MREEDWSFFEEDEFKEALRTYENMVNGGPSAFLDADELTDIAEYYMIKNRKEEANACIDYALSLHPDSVDPLVFLSRQSMFEGDLTRAHQIMEAIPDQEDREVLFLKAELLIRQGKPDIGFQMLYSFYEDCKEDKALFLNDCIDVCLDYYYHEKGLEWARVLYRKHPDYPKAKMVLANLLTLMGEDEEACTLLEEELTTTPYNLKAWVLLAESLSAMGKQTDAIDAAEYALAIDSKNPHAMLVKANCLYHQNKAAEAHSLYEEYQQVFPNDDNGFYLDGLCLANMERYPEAISKFRKALEQDHTLSGLTMQIYIHLALVLAKEGLLTEALEALDLADESRMDGEKMEKELLRGHAFLENGKSAEAFQEFQVAVENSEDPSQTWITISISMVENGLISHALTVLKNIAPDMTQEQHQIADPYLAYCSHEEKDWQCYLYYLPMAIKESKETVEYLLGPSYPGKKVEEFYEAACQEAKDAGFVF